MEATIEKCDERNFNLYDGCAYDAPDAFDAVMRDLAERYLEEESYRTGEEPEDYEKAIQHELDIMDHWSVWEEVERLLEADLDDAMDQIESRVHGRNRVIAVGRIGLWDGTYDGGCVADHAGALINKVWSDCGTLSDLETIEVRDGDVHVAIVHHDGRCEFSMRALTDAGSDALDGWECGDGPLSGLSERDAHARLMSSPEYSYSIAPEW